MSWLNVFGLFAVSAMVICYALEGRSHWFVLAFAGSCGLASSYGFLQGAWPFGIVEALWFFVALRRWWLGRRVAVEITTSLGHSGQQGSGRISAKESLR
jgi:hypothetical protein